MVEVTVKRDGTTEKPYEINSAEDIKQFAEDVNAGNDFAGKFFVLTADIELSGNWTPIGYRNRDGKKPFSGTFDGQGHTISNLTFDNPSSDRQVLFGYVDGGTIKNVNISGKYSVGGLVGYNDGTIENCTVNNTTVSGKDFVGGLVGYNNATVENCTVSNTTINGNAYVGGFVGRNLQNGKIKGSNYWHGNCSEAVGRNEGKITGNVTRVDSGGTCGNNVTWTLDKNGTFVVSGTGNMRDYSSTDRPEWYKNRDKIKRVFVGKGVTSVGDWAFADCPNLKRVVLSSTVQFLKNHAFENCPSLKLYYRNGTRSIRNRGKNDKYVSC